MISVEFLRFVTTSIDRDSCVPVGLYQFASDLVESGDVESERARQMSELLQWFDVHLEEPDRFNRTKSKGYYRRSTKGISWFKASAVEDIEKMRQIGAMVEACGHQLQLIRETKPGYVVYEDEHQVVAEPFRDTRTSGD